MKFDVITEPDKRIATKKWKEYKQAERVARTVEDSRCISIYKELGKIYHRMKAGNHIIDISRVIHQGGVKEPGRPNFAVGRANLPHIICEYDKNGSVSYIASQWRKSAGDIHLGNILPKFTMTNFWDRQVTLKAPIPIIPPKYRPKRLTNDYYILWQVDEWKMIPSADPYLLKRLTRNHFLLLEGWDLTPLEISVMKNYM